MTLVICYLCIYFFLLRLSTIINYITVFKHSKWFTAKQLTMPRERFGYANASQLGGRKSDF